MEPETYTVFTQALDDVVEVSTGLLSVRRELAHLKSSLLSENVHLIGPINAIDSLLPGQISGGLPTHLSHRHLSFFVCSTTKIVPLSSNSNYFNNADWC